MGTDTNIIATRAVSLRQWLAPGSDVPDVSVQRCVGHDTQVCSGDVFIALATEPARAQHMATAIQRGAQVVIMDSKDQIFRWAYAAPDKKTLRIEMPGLKANLGYIMASFYGDPSRQLQVAAVTGTNGKSSCSVFYAQALHALQRPCGVLGTLGCGVWPDLAASTHTTPDAIALQQHLSAIQHAGAHDCVLEASSHALAQDRLQSVDINMAVLTNLSQDHLDYHGDMEAYAAAKAKLFAPSVPYRIVNIDDETGRKWAQQWAGNGLLTYGWRALSDKSYPVAQVSVYAHDVCCSDDGFTAKLYTPWGHGSLQCSVLGSFNVSNVLAVVAMLGASGVPFDRILYALAQLQPVLGRMQRIQQPHAPLVVVDFAHTPDALAHALQALRSGCAGRLWCVFGCGGDRDQSKRPLMAAQAQRYADQVVVTSDNPRSEDPLAIIDGIRQGFQTMQSVCYIADRAQAIAHAVTSAAPGDVVLVAGKGHEQCQIIGQQRHAFCDVTQVRLALERRGHQS
jgi:UDP-N-acetylmuramoyl-L-alanyl-D-glutamate--2,6-diaminopimelate ligase